MKFIPREDEAALWGEFSNPADYPFHSPGQEGPPGIWNIKMTCFDGDDLNKVYFDILLDGCQFWVYIPIGGLFANNINN